MTQITTKLIKQLYEKVDAKVLECQEALEKTHGDVAAALELLIKEGLAPESNLYGDEGTLKTIESKNSSEAEVEFQLDITPKKSYYEQTMTQFMQVIGAELLKQRPLSVEEFLQLPYSEDPSLTIQQLFELTEKVVANTILLRWFKFEETPKSISVVCPDIYPSPSRLFVSLKGNPDKHYLGYRIASHIIAYRPSYITCNEVPQELILSYISSYSAELNALSEQNRQIFIKKKQREFYQKNCLLELPLLSDESLTIQDEINHIKKITGIDYSVSHFYFLDVV